MNNLCSNPGHSFSLSPRYMLQSPKVIFRLWCWRRNCSKAVTQALKPLTSHRPLLWLKVNAYEIAERAKWQLCVSHWASYCAVWRSQLRKFCSVNWRAEGRFVFMEHFAPLLFCFVVFCFFPARCCLEFWRNHWHITPNFYKKPERMAN